MKTPDLSTASRLLAISEEFRAAGRLCGLRKDLPPPDGWLPAPEVVNLAFAVELALKGLQALYISGPVRSHDLLNLCSKLPDAVVSKIRGEIPPKQFNVQLDSVRNAFNTWRYAHERAAVSMNLGFLVALADTAIALLKEELIVHSSPHRSSM